MRKAAFVLVALAGFTWNPSIDLALATSQGGTITGTVTVRERANDDESLLVAVTGGDDTPVTRFEVTLPDRFPLRLGYVTEGWAVKVDGKRITASGPSAARVYLRMDASPREQILKKLSGKRCRMRAWQDDELLFGIEHAILPDPRVGTQFTLDDAITLPPIVTDGGLFVATPNLNFQNGEWKLYVRDTALADDTAALKGWQLKVTELNPPLPSPVFGIASEGLRFQYTDPFGDMVIDSAPAWRVVPKGGACSPALTGGSALAFSGKPACLTGCFEELGKAFQFLLDDAQPVKVQAMSPSSIVVGVPDTVAPGVHTFSIRQSDASLGTHTMRVMLLQGSIDQSELMRGGSTTMRLGILGHDEPVPLEVVNQSPTIITVDGGDRQKLLTSGGTPNAATRTVHGIMKGDFTIDYSLDLPPCGLPK